MLRSIKDLIGYPIDALDGRIGKIKDCLFDDRYWRIRYLVADTGKWLPGKKVLLSPLHLESLEVGERGNAVPVKLKKAELEECPELSADAPVSKQYEEEFARYYKLPFYWVDPYAYGYGAGTDPVLHVSAEKTEAERQAHEFHLKQIQKAHLRSAHEIIGYHIDAKDDSFGHVEDFIVDDQNWRLQYLVIDTKNWLPGKSSLIDIGWVENFNWQKKTAKVDLLRKQIEIAPKFDPCDPVNKDSHQKLYDYYGKPMESTTPAAPFF